MVLKKTNMWKRTPVDWYFIYTSLRPANRRAVDVVVEGKGGGGFSNQHCIVRLSLPLEPMQHNAVELVIAIHSRAETCQPALFQHLNQLDLGQVSDKLHGILVELCPLN